MSIAQLIDALGGFAGGFSQNYAPGNSDVGNYLKSQYGGGDTSSTQTGGGGGGGLGGILQYLFGGGGKQSSGGGGGYTPAPVSGGDSGPTYNPPPSFAPGGSSNFQGRTQLNLPSAIPSPQMNNAFSGVSNRPVQPTTPNVFTTPAAPSTPLGQGGIGSDANAKPPVAPSQGGGTVGTPVGATSNATPGVTGTPTQDKQLGTGPLSLEGLVRGLIQRTPNISGARLEADIHRFLPMLTQQGLEQFRNLELQQRQESISNLQADREDRSKDRKTAEQDRLLMNRERIDAATSRLQEQIDERKAKFEAETDYKKAKDQAVELRAAIKAKQEAISHLVATTYSGVLTDEQKKDIYEQVKTDAKEEEDRVNELLKSKSGGKETSKSSETNSERANAEAAIKQSKTDPRIDPEAVKRMYKERTGEDY